jgi:hypothetical protein
MIKTTGRYLLLGAGWMSNFGAPLARQMWSMILGALPADAPTALRASLRNNLDFEELYGDVMDGSDP